MKSSYTLYEKLPSLDTNLSFPAYASKHLYIHKLYIYIYIYTKKYNITSHIILKYHKEQQCIFWEEEKFLFFHFSIFFLLHHHHQSHF